MSNQLDERVPKDPEQIDLDDPVDVEYWVNELDVAQSHVEAAVVAVGPFVKDVRAYLGR